MWLRGRVLIRDARPLSEAVGSVCSTGEERRAVEPTLERRAQEALETTDASSEAMRAGLGGDRCVLPPQLWPATAAGS